MIDDIYETMMNAKLSEALFVRVGGQQCFLAHLCKSYAQAVVIVLRPFLMEKEPSFNTRSLFYLMMECKEYESQDAFEKQVFDRLRTHFPDEGTKQYLDKYGKYRFSTTEALSELELLFRYFKDEPDELKVCITGAELPRKTSDAGIRQLRSLHARLETNRQYVTADVLQTLIKVCILMYQNDWCNRILRNIILSYYKITRKVNLSN